MARKPPILEKWDFILMLGESGAGKGTLVEGIKRHWLPEVNAAGMGDIFRRRATDDPEIKQLTEQGVLIDDKVAYRIFCDFADSNHPGLIDGFPRNRQQAINLIKFIKEKGWRVLVVDLHCNIDKIIERLLSRSRADDKLSIMYKRHTDHMNLHPAVMEEIKNRPDIFDVITLNGNLNAEIVFSNFLLDVLRLVDMLNLYELNNFEAAFNVYESETNINPAINRWLCGFLNKLQEREQR
ncbi:MAG: nucleoside monophosphate kinase [Defluviitaleaceae bacterium]|nr:nucleoside monophosphate kinase [Defluviitaleaceae bacterium]